jgi:hypothetical protein
MNKYRILCRQENPELKSVYDPYVFRRKGDWLEIDIRGRLDILQMFDGQGNPLNIDTMQARAPTPEEAQTLIDKSEKAPITPEIQAQLDIVKRDFDEYQDMLKHGPHRLDPDKPLIDDEEPTNAES